MIRIVGGKFRGKKLRVPEKGDVRPTTDRVREALFNVLDHRFGRPCHEARVLDLFAGTGALGLEAASRGAASVTLVEGDGAVAKTTRTNAKGFVAEVHVQRVDAWLKGTATPYDIVFMDPPYQGGFLDDTLAKLAQGGWLADDAIVCVEHAANVECVPPTGMFVEFTRRYGATVLSVLKEAK